MLVHIPSPLRSYTGNKSQVECTGSSLDELLRNLDAEYPGIKFRMIDEQDRIRQHIKIYVDREPVDQVYIPLKDTVVVHIICALSGG